MINSYFIIIAIALFSYTVISIMIYIAVSSYLDKKEEKNFKALDNDFGNLIERHLELTKSKGVINEEELKYVRGKLKDKLWFKVFSKRIIEFAKEDKINSTEYVKNYKDYLIKMFIKTDQKSIMKFAYDIYLIGEFRINDKEVNRLLLDNLNSDAIFVRANSLKSLSKIGDVGSFSDAIKIISLRGLYFNQKIIIDAIDAFEGDVEELNKVLIDEIKNFTEDMTNIVINHFENTRYVECRDFLLNMLKGKDTPKNTVTRIIRYFHYVHYDKAENEIIQLFNSPSWEVRVVAAKAISTYNVDSYSNKLAHLVSDPNYNVRYNAAMTLISNNKNQDIIDNFINGEDKYARDIIIYALFTNNKITYDKYVELLANEEEKGKAEVAITNNSDLALEGGK